MTNAIETTKREMYRQIERMKYNADILALPPLAEMLGLFETAHEAHLEQLRQQYEQMAAMARDRFESIQSLEQSGQDLTAKLSAMTEERDSMRNQLQALQMASQTSAEVIRGLHSELLEARECNAIGANLESPKPAHSDPYKLGFNSEGNGPNPFPLNTIERSRWYKGASDAITAKNHSYEGFCTSSGEMFFGDKS